MKSGVQSDFIICWRVEAQCIISRGNSLIAQAKCRVGYLLSRSMSVHSGRWVIFRPLLLIVLVNQCDVLYLKCGSCWTLFIHCIICHLFFNQNWAVGGVIPHSVFGILDPICQHPAEGFLTIQVIQNGRSVGGILGDVFITLLEG